MKNLLRLAAIILLVGGAQAGSLSELLPGTHQDELKQIKSPDGDSTAILYHKERHGLGLPPEPPKTLDRWARLKVIKDGKTVYDSGAERLNNYQMSAGFALDVMWSPDSSYLAYRHITALRVIRRDGKVIGQPLVPQDSAIASFAWIDGTSLLLVAKKTRYPLDMSGKPYLFNGYTDQARDIRIMRLHLTNGVTTLFQQVVNDPTFLFHSVSFFLDEISPKADRVAFSDGANLCVYDSKAGKLITTIKIPQKPPPKPNLPPDYPPEARKAVTELSAEPAQLEGVWWQDNDRLVIGVGLLGFPAKSFYTYNIPSNAMTDVTSVLLPKWEGDDKTRNYQNSEWYRPAIK